MNTLSPSTRKLAKQIKETMQKSKLAENLNEHKLHKTSQILAVQRMSAINKFDGGALYESIINESSGGQPTTPQNSLGNGNPTLPYGIGGDTGNQNFHDPNYSLGSGDYPSLTLQIATTVAAATVGMDIVNTVPMDAPYTMLQYIETLHGNGTLEGTGENDLNSPIYVAVQAPEIATTAFRTALDSFNQGDILYFYGGLKALRSKFLGFSSYSPDKIYVKVEQKGQYDGVSFVFTPDAVTSIADIFLSDVDLAGETVTMFEIDNGAVIDLTGAKVDFARTDDIHIEGFSNIDGLTADPMRREENQDGIGNTLEARISSKMVEAESYEVTYIVTRMQLQDYPKVGVEVLSYLAEKAQNEIIQSINKDIIKTVKRLGVSHAVELKLNDHIDHNIVIAQPSVASEDMVDFPNLSEFKDKNGVDQKAVFTGIENAFVVAEGETRASKRAEIAAMILGAASRIGYSCRRGEANFAVVPPSLAAALRLTGVFQNMVFDSTIPQKNTNMYSLGMLGDLMVYVNPHEKDNVVIIGRKGEISEPGVYFLPYIVADHHSTTPEGTFGYKGLVNTRYGLVDAGWHPERHYLTIAYWDKLRLIR